MEDTTGDAINWLLSSAEPAVRLLARRDLLGQDVLHTDEVLDGPMVRTLLSGQCPDGGFGVHPYRKWTGPIGDWCPWSSWASPPANRGPCGRQAPCSTG